MQDIITLLVFGGLIFLVLTMFLSLAPYILPFILITMVFNYFVRRKRQKDFKEQYRNYQQSQGYDNSYYQQDASQSQTNYETSGNIRHDVIDVEYTETEEELHQ